MSTVKYVSGDISVTFYVAVNAKKSLKEFCDHEAHTGLTPDQLKEAYELIKNAAAPAKKQIAQAKPAEQTD